MRKKKKRQNHCCEQPKKIFFCTEIYLGFFISRFSALCISRELRQKGPKMVKNGQTWQKTGNMGIKQTKNRQYGHQTDHFPRKIGLQQVKQVKHGSTTADCVRYLWLNGPVFPAPVVWSWIQDATDHKIWSRYAIRSCTARSDRGILREADKRVE